MMQRELGSFPFPPPIRAKLKDNGFGIVEDVFEMKPTELSRGRILQSFALTSYDMAWFI